MNAVSSNSTPNTDPALSGDKINNLASLSAGTAAASAVALGVSATALKVGLLAAAGTVSLATWSPAAVAAAGGLVALGAATGLPIVKGLFVTAAFAATHWATKKAISAVQAVADAAGTIKTMSKKTVEGVGNLIGGSERPAIMAPQAPAAQYAVA